MFSIAARRSAAAPARVSASVCSSSRTRTALSENLHGCSHRADFITAPNAGNLSSQFSLGQHVHARAELTEWTADAATDDPCRGSRNRADKQCRQTERQHNRPQLCVQIVEIGAGSDKHVPAGNRDGIANLAYRPLLVGFHIFIAEQDFAVGLHPVHQFAVEEPSIGRNVHAIGPDLFGIGREHHDALEVRGEQIAGAVIVGQRISAPAKLSKSGFLRELPSVHLLL
jgi:hypothetical protein